METSASTRLLEDLNHLGGQLGDGGATGLPPEAEPFEGWPPISMPTREDHDLLVALRVAFARIAHAHSPQGQSAEVDRSVRAALDGAQLTVRSEILAGQGDRVRELIPGLLYLTVMPAGGRALARHVAAQAAHQLDCGGWQRSVGFR